MYNIKKTHLPHNRPHNFGSPHGLDAVQRDGDRFVFGADVTDVGRALFRRIDHDARDAGITHAVTAGGRRSRRRSMQQRIRRRGAVSEQRRHNVDVIIVVDIVVVAAVVTTAIVAIASPPGDLTHRVDRVVTVAIVIIIVD